MMKLFSGRRSSIPLSLQAHSPGSAAAFLFSLPPRCRSQWRCRPAVGRRRYRRCLWRLRVLRCSDVTSWIDNNFTRKPAEQHVQPIQHISSHDPLMSSEIRLEPTGIVLTVEINPSLKNKSWNRTFSDTAHQPGRAFSRIQCQPLTIRPRYCARVRARVGNNVLQD